MIKRKLNSQQMAPYIFISPFFILFLIFGLYPIGYSFYMAFFKFKLSGASQFVGLQNFKIMLFDDPYFWKSLVNTLILLVFGSLLQHFIAIPLAIMLNSKLIKGREFFKTAFFLPYITSTVCVVMIFRQIFGGETFGWLNYIIVNFFNGTAVNWTDQPAAIKVVLSTIINWRWIGWNTIIYLAGLQAISPELYEAAEIDGAGGWRKHLSITLPLLLPIIFFQTTMSIIGGMQVFDEPFILLGGYELFGGTANSGLTSAFYIMSLGMRWLRFGKGSAVAWLLFVIIITMTIINKKVNKKFS